MVNKIYTSTRGSWEIQSYPFAFVRVFIGMVFHGLLCGLVTCCVLWGVIVIVYQFSVSLCIYQEKKGMISGELIMEMGWIGNYPLNFMVGSVCLYFENLVISGFDSHLWLEMWIGINYAEEEEKKKKILSLFYTKCLMAMLPKWSRKESPH